MLDGRLAVLFKVSMRDRPITDVGGGWINR